MNSAKSGVANHLIENQHTINMSNIKLGQEVNNNNHIDVIEAMHIRKN